MINNLLHIFLGNTRCDLCPITKRSYAEVEEVGSGDDKHEILSKIADQLDEFTRAQKIAIIRVLPASWSIREISAHTGRINK